MRSAGPTDPRFARGARRDGAPPPEPAGAGRSRSPVLRALAVRVRDQRRARGWTRADLADRAGLSVRYLARIEAGNGNVSLLRLVGLAEALEVPVDELLRVDEARTGVVALVGLRGAGKSTVGPMLARRLRIPFVEMDAAIEEASGLPVDQIFELHGERYYRRLERETLGRILSGDRRVVVAAAGGVVTEPSSWDLLRGRATVIWLKARPEDHWRRVVVQGDRRPMANRPAAMAELRAMLAARERIYSQAHFAVDTTGRTPRQIAQTVEEYLRRKAAAPVAKRAARRGARS